MKTALVIVDAYKKMHKDCETKDANAFCHFLNRVCDVERKKGTVIIHSVSYNQNNHREKDPSGNPISKESLNELIEFHSEDFFTDARNLYKILCDNNIDKVYFGGFHFGKCIFEHLRETYSQYLLQKKIFGGDNVFDCDNIVLNLSMILPKHSWLRHINLCGKKHNYYLWGPGEFELILKGTTYDEPFVINDKNL